jgi:hypothetical protein
MKNKSIINPDTCKTFKSKSKKNQNLINRALYILKMFGVPLNLSERRLERMAMAFLAVGGIYNAGQFKKVKDLSDEFSLKTREIIEFINKYFEETISSGSYDDIRRKDLKLLVLAEIVLPSNPASATNDSTRGYGLNPFYAKMIRKLNADDWEKIVKSELEGIQPLDEKLKRIRNIEKIPVKFPSGKLIELTPGDHNLLQKR